MLAGPSVRSIGSRSRFFFFLSEMDNHRLKTWLQLHLATDSSAAINLPFVLNGLTEEDFLSSGHVQKWTIRINSLLHSKDPGARWAGLSIALRTATLSRNVMNECAHGWITVTLPMLFVRSRCCRLFIQQHSGLLACRRTKRHRASKLASV
jgi:hypothetical protein